MLFPDQTERLITYINARLALDEAAENTGIAAAGSPAEAAEWDWVRHGRQQRSAIRGLLATIRKVTDEQLRQALLIQTGSMWAAHLPLVDRSGRPYTCNGGGLTYLTDCHLATPTISMGTLSCRVCYHEVESELTFPPEPAVTDELHRPGQPKVNR
ncbi:hypothetical protein AB0F93_00480 [Micromonospora tulbaghiae]|uniref:hypothetical protein n=1 Tax=Micromonospora tulbaghiae TaxID=479978 RepID=UPI00332706A9